MDPVLCRDCDHVQRLSIFEQTCENCGGVDLVNAAGVAE